LFNPFPSLVEAALSLNLESLDSGAHAHVPFPLLLLNLAHKYKEQVSQCL
jgi:hypothetical protein